MDQQRNPNGTLQETTYSKEEVYEFLFNTGNTFASLCWANDIVTGRPSYTQVATWFRRHFADPNRGQFLFRLMESHCTAHSATC